MPNVHPLFVHFPIALLLTSVALDWAGLRWKGRGLDQAAWYTLLLGLVATLFTIATGLLAAQNVPGDSPAAATLNVHKILGIVAFVVFGLQAVCHWRHHGVYSGGDRIKHKLVQFVGVALITFLGFKGGELVYTFGIGVAQNLR